MSSNINNGEKTIIFFLYNGIKTQISNVVSTYRFWHKLHQKVGKSNNIILGDKNTN